MTDLDHSLLRKLAEWGPADVPITSLYLTVDGRLHPRRADYEVRLDELLRSARGQVDGLPREAVRSVEHDLERMSAFVREEFERGDTRGLALFSADAAGLWQEVRVPRPVRNRAAVGPQADLLPLEALLEAHAPTCTALVDFEKARLFLLELGRIHEVHDVRDEVPGRHDQGGWAQMRMQRHVDDHRQRHLRHVADTLFALLEEGRFERLILAGPGEGHRELERGLHDYLARRIVARLTLAMTASAEEVRARSLAVEAEIERGVEHERVERLAGSASLHGDAVAGLEPTLAAVSEGRARELVVGIDLHGEGSVCDACGRLSSTSGRCPVCGAGMREVPDVVEAAVVRAYRTGCRVETVVADEGLARLGGVGALLRF